MNRPEEHVENRPLSDVVDELGAGCHAHFFRVAVKGIQRKRRAQRVA